MIIATTRMSMMTITVTMRKVHCTDDDYSDYEDDSDDDYCDN